MVVAISHRCLPEKGICPFIIVGWLDFYLVWVVAFVLTRHDALFVVIIDELVWNLVQDSLRQRIVAFVIVEFDEFRNVASRFRFDIEGIQEFHSGKVGIAYSKNDHRERFLASVNQVFLCFLYIFYVARG